MVGDEAGLLIAVAQVAQQGRQIVVVVELAELALNQVLQEERAPAARRIAGRALKTRGVRLLHVLT
jgi:hypothetical protein